MGSVASLAGVSTRYAGWFYPWVVAGAVLCALWFAFSRGELVLGGEDEEPAYSRGAWFSMLLRRGHGHRPGVLGRGGADLALREPPPGVTARSPEAVGAAMRYSFSGAFRGSRAIDCSVAVDAWKRGSARAPECSTARSPPARARSSTARQIGACSTGDQPQDDRRQPARTGTSPKTTVGRDRPVPRSATATGSMRTSVRLSSA